MCIVIYQPKGKQVQKAILQKAFENNPDGAGFMVQKDKEAPYMMKGFFDFDKFYKSYLPFSKGDYNVAIHFRIATHGTVNKDNCHPFKISSDIADRFSIIAIISVFFKFIFLLDESKCSTIVLTLSIASAIPLNFALV